MIHSHGYMAGRDFMAVQLCVAGSIKPSCEGKGIRRITSDDNSQGTEQAIVGLAGRISTIVVGEDREWRKEWRNITRRKFPDAVKIAM